MSFDPEEILKAVERIREAFNRAAEADSGNAQRLFEKLATRMDALITQGLDPRNQNMDRRKILLKMLPSLMEVKAITAQLQREIQTNSDAAAVLEQLLHDIQEEAKTVLPLLGNLPNIPGLPKLPGMDFGQPKQPPQEPPAPPVKKPDAPPRKRGGGKFNF